MRNYQNVRKMFEALYTTLDSRHEYEVNWCRMCQETHGCNKFYFIQPTKEKKPRKNQRVNEPDKLL